MAKAKKVKEKKKLTKDEVRLVIGGYESALFEQWLRRIRAEEREIRTVVEWEQKVFDALTLDRPRKTDVAIRGLCDEKEAKAALKRLAESGTVEKVSGGWVRKRGARRPVDYENVRVTPELRTYLLRDFQDVVKFLGTVRAQMGEPQSVRREIVAARLKHERGLIRDRDLKRAEKQFKRAAVDVTRVLIACSILDDAREQLEKLTISCGALVKQLFMVRDNLRVAIGEEPRDPEALEHCHAGRLPPIPLSVTC